MKAGRRQITQADIEVEAGTLTALPSNSTQEIEYLTGLFVRLPVSQKKWIESLAESRGESLAEIVRTALKDYETKLSGSSSKKPANNS